MGTPFDFYDALSEPRHEEMFLRQGKLKRYHYENRMLLRNVMRKAGFYPLSIEWWHFDAFPGSDVRRRYGIVE